MKRWLHLDGSMPIKEELKIMKPGLNQIIVHLAIDNDEMQAISKGHDAYGSAWRQNDLDLVSDPEFKTSFEEK